MTETEVTRSLSAIRPFPACPGGEELFLAWPGGEELLYLHTLGEAFDSRANASFNIQLEDRARYAGLLLESVLENWRKLYYMYSADVSSFVRNSVAPAEDFDQGFFSLWAKKSLLCCFSPIFGNFCCPVVTLVTFSSNLKTLRGIKILKKSKKNPKKNLKLNLKIQNSKKKLAKKSKKSKKKSKVFQNIQKKIQKVIKNVQKIQKSSKNLLKNH